LQEITVESSKTKKTSLATVRETAAATRTQSLLETAAEIVEPAVQASSSSEDVTHSFSEAGTDERMTNSLAGWSSDLSLTDDSENFDVGQHITCMDWCKLPVYLSGYSLLPQRQTTWLLCVACNP
jgi:hypothetical protein